MKLHPAHKEDLRLSGLNIDSIKRSGIESLRPADIRKIVPGGGKGVESAYRIPYPGTDGFSRYRLFYGEHDSCKSPKYIQPAGSENRLYIPDSVNAVLQDPSSPLYFTEGEKKALKASQEGITCIGLSGLWNWKNKSDELVDDFRKIDFTGRKIYVVPDNDYRQPNRHGYKKNLEQAVERFAKKLMEQGAEVYIIELPVDSEKIGLDDFLVTHSADEFYQLTERRIFSLEQKIENATHDDLSALLREVSRLDSESRKEIFIERISKKLKIGKRALRADLKCYDQRPAQADCDNQVMSADFPELVDLVLDDTGSIAYLVKNDDGLAVSASWEVDGQSVVPPEKQHLPFTIPRAHKILEHLNSDDSANLFNDIVSYLKRFSCVQEGQWSVIASAIMLSYVHTHPDISYCPYLLFYAVPERGKSRTGKSAMYICYRGIHVVEVRETNLFRYAENLQAGLFIDCMNLWRKAEKNSSEDILLLRYEKGARVSRVLYPDKGAFRDTEYYTVYGPTFIATNEPLHHILDTRCIPITMPNRPGQYEDPKPEHGLELKERLTAWRAHVMDERLPEVEPVAGITGRFADITMPLLKICKRACPHALEGLTQALVAIAHERTSEKQNQIEGQIIQGIQYLSKNCGNDIEIPLKDLLDYLNQERPDPRKMSPQRLGKKIQALGIRKRKIDGRSQILLSRDELNKLAEQYGIEKKASDTPDNSLPLATNEFCKANSSVCPGSESSGENNMLPDSLQNKSKEKQKDTSLVESSSECGQGGEENIFDLTGLKIKKVGNDDFRDCSRSAT